MQDVQPRHAERGARAAGRDLTIERRLVRHRHRHERLGQVDAAQRGGRLVLRRLRAASRSPAPTSRRGPSTARAADRPRVPESVQRHGARPCRSPRTSRWRRGAASRAGSGWALGPTMRDELRDRVAAAEHGPRGSARQPDRQPVGRPAAGADAADGDVAEAASCCCSTSTPPRSIPRAPTRSSAERGDRRARPAHDPDGDALDAAGRRPRRPLVMMHRGAGPARLPRRGEAAAARRGSARALRGVRRGERLDETARGDAPPALHIDDMTGALQAGHPEQPIRAGARKQAHRGLRRGPRALADLIFKVNLALDEVITNIVLHA